MVTDFFQSMPCHHIGTCLVMQIPVVVDLPSRVMHSFGFALSAAMVGRRQGDQIEHDDVDA